MGLRFVAAFLLCAGAVTAQTSRTIAINGNPTCGGCRIELLPVMTIGGPGRSEGLGGRSGFPRAMDSHGRVYMLDDASPGVVLLFDSTGRRIATIGRAGRGPGEFTAINDVIVDVGDSLHTFDYANGRHSVFSPTTLKYVRAARWNTNVWVPAILPLSGGRFVISDPYAVDGKVSRPFRIVDSTARTIISMGTTRTPMPSNSVGDSMRVLAPAATPEHFLAAFPAKYRIEEWGLDGRQHASIVRTVGWFPPDSARPRLADDGPWVARITSVWRDANGLIWTVIIVGDRRWEESLDATVTTASGNVLRTPSDYNRFFDTRIEVLDLATGTVVASQRFDRMYPWRIRADGTLTSAMALELGDEPTWHLVRPRLVRPRQK